MHALVTAIAEIETPWFVTGAYMFRV